MTTMMLQFASFLRYRGFTVATSALNDAITALEHIDLLDREQFYFALQGCFINRSEDRQLFKKLFHRFFEDRTPLEFEHLESATKRQVLQFAKQLRNQGGYADAVLADYIEGDITGLLNAVEADSDQPSMGSQRSQSDGSSAEQRRKMLLKTLGTLHDERVNFADVSYQMTRDQREVLSDFLRRRLQEAQDALEKRAPKRPVREHLLPWERQRSISTIAFDQLTNKERKQVKEAVEKLAQKLKDALTRRKKRARRGSLDIKNTIRGSLRYGGVPFDFKRRVHPRKKGKIVALCDISMSVAYQAHLMLLLLYRLQDRFSKIRSFVFVRDTFEISYYFKENSLESAVKKAVKHHGIGLGQLTNYGIAFETFFNKYSSALTKDTTLIILGDGENNRLDPKVDCLRQITEKVRRTIWLNTEEEKAWYNPTNVIMEYKPYCDELIECGTLEQLSDFVENLVI